MSNTASAANTLARKAGASRPLLVLRMRRVMS